MSDGNGSSQKSSKEVVHSIRSATYNLLQEIDSGNVPDNRFTKERLCQILGLINSLISEPCVVTDEVVQACCNTEERDRLCLAQIANSGK